MNKRSVLIGLAVLVAVAMAAASLPLLALADQGNQQTTCPGTTTGGMMSDGNQVSAVAFHDAWRALWEDHVWYTREAVIDILRDSPSTNATIQRLLVVAADTRDMMRPYYGAQVDAFYTELVGHFVIAAQIVAGVRNGADVTPLVDAWFVNARNMSVMMNQMNPQFWVVDEVNAMWDEHLNLTIQEATQYHTGQYAASIATFDMIDDQGNLMADMFSNGIMDQFPDQFSNRNCIVSLNTTCMSGSATSQ